MMKCHYEVLEVPFDANAEDLKKAYRKAALRWHPDKNPSNVDEAKRQFQLVQQAYEVLSDSHERAWYDAHRDAILKGGLGENYQDDSLNVYPYFSSSCYSGYGDDEKGFYTVYREVFNKIITEDMDYMSESDDPLDIPTFGTSTSDFNEVVSRFYKYWQDYTTKKSYSWLDEYDIKDLPNRRIAKLVEKENKKIRDRARKERNEEVRNLVVFVRKRDKRVQAQSKLMKIQAQEKAKKAAEKKKAKIKERQEELKRLQEAEWAQHHDMEAELKNLEQSLGDNQGENQDLDALFCIACNKVFKTDKSFANHENSKKHKENVKELKQRMLEEEEEFDNIESERENQDKDSVDSSSDQNGIPDELANKIQDLSISSDDSDCNSVGITLEEDLPDDSETKTVSRPVLKKNKKIKKKVLAINDSDVDEKELDDTFLLSKKQRKKLQDRVVDNRSYGNGKVKDDDIEGETLTGKSNKRKGKEACKQKKVDEADRATKTTEKNVSLSKTKKDSGSANVPPNVDHCCVTCKSSFTSKNKLFEHLKSTGHSVYLPGKGLQGNVRKSKVKQK